MAIGLPRNGPSDFKRPRFSLGEVGARHFAPRNMVAAGAVEGKLCRITTLISRMHWRREVEYAADTCVRMSR